MKAKGRRARHEDGNGDEMVGGKRRQCWTVSASVMAVGLEVQRRN